MPIEFAVNSDCGCVFTRITGTITAQEVLAYLRRLREAPGYQAEMPRLVDARQVDDMLSPAELRAIAEAVRQWPDIYDGKRALVADRDLVYGMLRMFELLTSQTMGGYRAFRDVREAAEWLQVDCPSVRALMAEPAHAGG